MKQFYRLVRKHSIANTMVWMALLSIVFGITGAVYADDVTGGLSSILGNAEAVYGAIVGATSGYGFSEWQNAKAWKRMVSTKDKEIARLTIIENKYMALTEKALGEKLEQ